VEKRHSLLLPFALAAATFACTSPAAPTSRTYTGSFVGEELLSSGTNGVASCRWRMSYTGTMKITLEQRQDETAAGTAEVQATQYAVISQLLGPAPPDPRCFDYKTIVNNWTIPVTGTRANLAFSGQRVENGTSTNTLTLTGSLTGEIISGTATYTESTQGASSTNTGGYSSGSATFPVTMR
jgi:hypothetical protein